MTDRRLIVFNLLRGLAAILLALVVAAIFIFIFGGFKNSFIISACSTVLSIYFSAMAAYGLVAYKFKGRKILYAGILGLVMIPTQISMIGFYQFVSKISIIYDC